MSRTRYGRGVGSGWRLVLTSGAVLVLALLPACSDDGPERGVEPFCEELRSGAERMAANVRDTSGDVELLVGALANIGEFARMLDRAAAVAPEEIRPDAEVVAKSWRGQAESAGDAFKDPLAALTTAAISGILDSASTRAFESYVNESCGLALFTSAPGTTGERPPHCVDIEPLEVGASVAHLEAALTTVSDLAAEVDDDLDLDQVLGGVSELDPPPQIALEALGRLRWLDDPVDPEAPFRAATDLLESTCGGSLAEPSFLETLAAASPRPLAGHSPDGGRRHLTLGAYRPFCNAQQLQSVRFVVVNCGEQSFVLDSNDGTITPTAVPSDARLVGDQWFWIAEESIAPDGLEQERQIARVMIADLSGTDQKALLEEEGHLFIATVGPERLALSRIPAYVAGSDDVPAEVIVIDTSGKVLFRQEADVDLDRVDEVVGAVDIGWVAGVNRPLLDLWTLQVVSLPHGVLPSGADRCSPAALYAPIYDPGAILHRRGNGELVVQPLGETDGGWPVAGGIARVGDGFETSLVMHELNGAVRWTLADGVVDSIYLFGDQLFVTNQAGKLIALDSATGREASDQPNDVLASFVTSDQAGLVFDHETGEVSKIDWDGDVAIMRTETFDKCRRPIDRSD